MRSFKTALKHLRHTPYQTLLAILLSSLTFFVISVFTITNLGLNTLIHYFESTPQVTAFFKNTATDKDIQQLKQKIQATGLADKIDYVSKEEALKIYQQQNKDNPLLLEMVTADILPASLEVSAKNIANLGKIAEVMHQDPQVEEVVYQQDVISALQKWTRGIRYGGLTFSLVFFLISLITFTVIIGLKIANKRQEINTLSLLGATSWYIRAPFFIEGMVYGLLGSLLGWGLVYILLLYLTPNLNNFFQGIISLPIDPSLMLLILGAQSVLGLLLGWFAAVIAAYRYGK